MTDSKIMAATLKVFAECEIQSFPVDCTRILKHYKYKIYTYRELELRNKELYEMCMDYSEDAFQDGHSKIIAYNQDKPESRIRFSLMHELGHHILCHRAGCVRSEQEANAFSSNLLAPRMAIYYSRCKSALNVAHIFKLSYEAASHAFNDYQKWYRHVTEYKMSHLDIQMYEHFYLTDARCFVWSIHSCEFCGKILYNNHSCGCQTLLFMDYSSANAQDEIGDEDNHRRFENAMNHWLYGE